MKRYIVPHFEKDIDWRRVDELHIDQYQFAPQRAVKATAKVCWTAHALHVHMTAKEPEILAQYHGDCDPVYEDSCLEMFVCPCAGDDRYFNLECNPNGSMYFGFGYGRDDRMRLHPADIRALLAVKTNVKEDEWMADFALSRDTIALFFPDFHFKSGARMRANFYKCGNRITPPHELMWSPITNGKQDFHQSEFFGELILE